MREQERQLARRHVDEDCQQRLSRYRSDLLSALERVKHQATTRHTHEAAVLVGAVREGKLVLPWENELDAKRFRRSLEDTAFGIHIRRAEREELTERRLDQAAEHYRAAIMEARLPSERAYAGLLLARTTQKIGRQGEARKEYRAVLQSGAEFRDEYGVPLALYAAPALLDAGSERNEILQLLHALMRDRSRLGPATLHRMRDLAGKLGAADLTPVLDRWIGEHEQAEALQADVPRLLARLATEDPVWIPFGEPVWLVSLAARIGGTEPVLVAVSAARLRGLLSPSMENARIVQGKEGQPLGDSFPGLHVILPEGTPQKAGFSGTFMTLSLVLVMTLTLFAGYLLWRDVRRDGRLAELRSNFVSSVSHELRTPLTSIRMFTERMRLDDEMHPDTRAEYLDTILRESERLSRLVDNVLCFARIEQGRATYDLQPVSLAGVIENAVRAFGHVTGQSGFRLDLDVAPGLPAVLADRDALQQAILNLLGNAVKYSGSSREITLRLERENENAAIRVIDHGIGIAAEEQAHIFERFYRAATSENQHIPGTGLGLTLVDHIATAHGGSSSVKSCTGAGSTFTIRIPFAHGSTVPAGAAVAEQP